MKTLDKPTILNWPSGAGGDFIVSLVHLMIGKATLYDPNINKFGVILDPEDLRYFNIEENPAYSPEILNNVDHNSLISFHDLNNYLNKHGYDCVDDGIHIINIDNTNYNLHTGLLYVIKSQHTLCRKPDAYDMAFARINYSGNIASVIKAKNFHNISYKRIFARQYEPEIERLYSLLMPNCLDLFYENKQQIIKIINLYHSINDLTVRRLDLHKLRAILTETYSESSIDIADLDVLEHELNKALALIKNT